MVVVEGKFRAVGSRPINENARYKQILHDRARRIMVLLHDQVQFFKIAVLSLMFCVSVVFGNISLRFLPVSFNQAIGVFREKAYGFSLPWI